MAQLHAKWIRRLFLNTLTYIQRKKKATTNLQDRVFKITIVKLMSKQSNWSFQNKLAFDCLKEGKVDINLNKSIIICTDANILPMINPNRLLNWKSPLLKKKKAKFTVRGELNFTVFMLVKKTINKDIWTWSLSSGKYTLWNIWVVLCYREKHEQKLRECKWYIIE